MKVVCSPNSGVIRVLPVPGSTQAINNVSAYSVLFCAQHGCSSAQKKFRAQIAVEYSNFSISTAKSSGVF